MFLKNVWIPLAQNIRISMPRVRLIRYRTTELFLYFPLFIRWLKFLLRNIIRRIITVGSCKISIIARYSTLYRLYRSYPFIFYLD